MTPAVTPAYTPSDDTVEEVAMPANDGSPPPAPIGMVRPKHTALMFTGKDVSEFLQEYNRQTTNAKYTGPTKVSVLPDYVDASDRYLLLMVKRMKGYKEMDWEMLQKSMKEHWSDQDTSVHMGKRAYLQAYIQESLRVWPGLRDYYAQFMLSAEKCVENGEIVEEEIGLLFFRGLPKNDKEVVMFQMPGGPSGGNKDSYDADLMFKYLKDYHKKKERLDELHQSDTGGADARLRQIIEENRKATFTPKDVRDAVRQVQQAQEQQQKQLPADVDPEIDDLIKSLGDLKIGMAAVNMLQAHQDIGRLLSRPSNYAYFVSRATIHGMSTERNDGTFISGAPINVNTSRGVRRVGNGEMRDTCNMCGKAGHMVRDCVDWNDLLHNGWISFTFDPERRMKTYFFGPYRERLDEIKERCPPTYQLDWVKAKIREFFNVTDDVMDQPASQVRPEKFKGDSRDRRYSPRGSDPAYQKSANMITQHGYSMGEGNLMGDFQHFQGALMRPGSEDDFTTLDEIDTRSIILNAHVDGGRDTLEANAASRPKPKDTAARDADGVRDGQIKKRGRPKKYTASHRDGLSDIDDIPSIGRSQDTDMGGDDSFQSHEGWSEIPYVSQPHDDPFTIVKPSHDSMPKNLSIDPQLLQQGKKKKAVKFVGPLDGPELRDLAQGHPTRIAAALLSQEVRGLTVTDLLSQAGVRKQMRDLLFDLESGGGGGASVNMLSAAAATESGWASEHPDSVKLGDARATPPPTDSEDDTHDLSGLFAIPEEFCYSMGVNHANFQRVGAQTRHEVNGRGDTWHDDLDKIQSRHVRGDQRRAGLVQVTTELPECWVTVFGHAVKCLIDTGAQMNILRLSAARALKIPYEIMEQKLGEPPQGVTSANGTHDPFVGTAYNIPIKIGAVTTRTTFRIMANLSRSAILGGPWCAAARIAIQYNAFGRVTCRVLSEDGQHNTVFVASDPTPHHPAHLDVYEEDDENPENE
jgi:hypothetical protein